MSSPAQDRAWFIDQVREHQARLRASIRALGVRTEAVDDFAQDTLFLAWQKRAEFDPTGEFGAWVVQIARRLVANERRKEGRRSRILAGEVTDLMLQLAQKADGPLTCLERAEALTALQSCLGELQPQAREMIRWRYFDQLSPGAIAGHMGRSSNYVRQGLLRLRRTLSECLEHRLQSEGG